MSLCPKCGERVYFAERRSSLGKEWHRWCLRCEECGKVLNPGQHAEHKGLPYCHIPCYTALFGPTVYGHGSAIQAHNNFGNMAERNLGSPVKRSDFQSKVANYNDYHEGTKCVLTSREVNGRLILEGLLRVYWGVYRPIHLKPDDESPPPSWRHSYHPGAFPLNGTESPNKRSLEARRSSMDDMFIQCPDKDMTNGHPTVTRYNTVCYRHEKPRRDRRKRLSIINGHLYNQETSVFIPAYGSVTSVRINSLDPAPEVIRLLLQKFKVENDPGDFCLCLMKANGEIRILQETDCPLLERVLLGPLDEDKVFLMEKDRARTVSEEVAHYVSLPFPVLQGFLKKFEEEEKLELGLLKARYSQCRRLIQEQMAALAAAN